MLNYIDCLTDCEKEFKYLSDNYASHEPLTISLERPVPSLSHGTFAVAVDLARISDKLIELKKNLKTITDQKIQNDFEQNINILLVHIEDFYNFLQVQADQAEDIKVALGHIESRPKVTIEKELLLQDLVSIKIIIKTLQDYQQIISALGQNGEETPAYIQNLYARYGCYIENLIQRQVETTAVVDMILRHDFAMDTIKSDIYDEIFLKANLNPHITEQAVIDFCNRYKNYDACMDRVKIILEGKYLKIDEQNIDRLANSLNRYHELNLSLKLGLTNLMTACNICNVNLDFLLNTNILLSGVGCLIETLLCDQNTLDLLSVAITEYQLINKKDRESPLMLSQQGYIEDSRKLVSTMYIPSTINHSAFEHPKCTRSIASLTS